MIAPISYAQTDNNSLSPAQEIGVIKTPDVQDLNWGIGGSLNLDIDSTEPQPFSLQDDYQPNFDYDFEENWTTTGDKKSTSAAIPVLDF